MNAGNTDKPMSNEERIEFTNWAAPLFPGFTRNPDMNARAEQEWAVEKRIRALEEEGMTRSDAQGVVEAEDLHATQNSSRPKTGP